MDITRSDNVVAFWHENQENGFLSNLYHAPIIIDDVEWPTTEHWYQAMKHVDLGLIEKIRKLEKPIASKHLARKMCKKLNRWPTDPYKLNSMRMAIKFKFDQHPELKQKLMATWPATIIEDSPKDTFWGVGPDGNGFNWMGVLLMELRLSYITTENLPLTH